MADTVKPLDPVSVALDLMASLDLTNCQARFLLRVHHGMDSPTEIAKELNISAASVCGTAKGLWRRGFLVKVHDPLDTRRVAYKLSKKKGRAAVDKLLQPAAPDDQA